MYSSKFAGFHQKLFFEIARNPSVYAALSDVCVIITRASILLTIPVAFILKIPFFHDTLFPSIFHAGIHGSFFPLPAINGKSSICLNGIFIQRQQPIFRVENHHLSAHTAVLFGQTPDNARTLSLS